ncbi:MAG: amphi-Trp domain-containing protein [Candidatus Goldbacteria bacterium]|nr:amphi-Trp domain-containing protein [Candidatus Goldiibacteriota bacterium]
MSTVKDEFEYESLQDKESLIKYLDALKDGFMQGKIILGSGDKKIILEPAELLNLEVRARRKGRSIKLSLKCWWKNGENPGNFKTDTLVIESREEARK